MSRNKHTTHVIDSVAEIFLLYISLTACCVPIVASYMYLDNFLSFIYVSHTAYHIAHNQLLRQLPLLYNYITHCVPHTMKPAT